MEVPSGTSSALHGIVGRTETDVWAVGAQGTIVHWDGSGWLPSASGTGEDSCGIAAGPLGLLAVGNLEKIMQHP